MHDIQTIVTGVRSVSLSVCCAAQLGFAVLGHPVQLLPNNFGLTVVTNSLLYGDRVQPSVVARPVYTEPVGQVLDRCGCTAASQCFLYFTDVGCSAVDAYLLLSRVSDVVGLQNAVLTVCKY